MRNKSIILSKIRSLYNRQLRTGLQTASRTGTGSAVFLARFKPLNSLSKIGFLGSSSARGVYANAIL